MRVKKVGSIALDVIVTIWFIIAVFVTICLLSYNEFKVTKFGNNSLIIVDSDELEPLYKEGDLLVVKRISDNKIEVGDEVFYYNTSKDSETMIFTDVVQDKEAVTKTETTYTLNGSRVSGEYIMGSTASTKVYSGLGTVMGILTSKWGYMFLVIFPTLFAIIYEIMMIIDIARDKKDEDES